jgi:hypothetical protein
MKKPAFFLTENGGHLPKRRLISNGRSYISENILCLSLALCKDIPVTGRRGPLGCETSRLPHFLDNRLTDGGEVVSLMCRPPFTPQDDSWYSFLLKTESTPGP